VARVGVEQPQRDRSRDCSPWRGAAAGSTRSAACAWTVRERSPSTLRASGTTSALSTACMLSSSNGA